MVALCPRKMVWLELPVALGSVAWDLGSFDSVDDLAFVVLPAAAGSGLDGSLTFLLEVALGLGELPPQPLKAIRTTANEQKARMELRLKSVGSCSK